MPSTRNQSMMSLWYEHVINPFSKLTLNHIKVCFMQVKGSWVLWSIIWFSCSKDFVKLCSSIMFKLSGNWSFNNVARSLDIVGNICHHQPNTTILSILSISKLVSFLNWTLGRLLFFVYTPQRFQKTLKKIKIFVFLSIS